MGSGVRKFVSRAPRYVLQANDNQFMRYSTDSLNGAVFKTRLVNISETGAAFVVDQSSAPKIGELIRVELPVPGDSQIAWFGRVVRMEIYQNHSWWSTPDPFIDDEKMLLGVQFEQLPQNHRVAIRQGLEKKLIEELRERRRRQQVYLTHWVKENLLTAVGYAILCALSFSILYYLSRPSDNYDAHRGSPWGKRYQFFEFEKEER